MRPELIIKFQAEPAGPAVGIPMSEGVRVPLHDLLTQEGLSLHPLKTTRSAVAVPGGVGPAEPTPRTHLAPYWSVEGTRDRLGDLQARLIDLPGVEAAFVVPAPEVPSAMTAAGATPDFRSRQGYLGPAPGGVDALFAWTQSGGSGENVRIIDIEGDWVLDHEELAGRIMPELTRRPAPNADWHGMHDTFLQHGTAVLGQLIGGDDGRGVTGIAHGARIGVVSHMHGVQPGRPAKPATAISSATDLLGPGDIMLLEMHMPGPRYGFSADQGQLGYIPVEWWEHIFAAIKDATDRGILVVQAAGNGREDLDDPLFDVPASGSSPSWRNPFRRAGDPSLDSGAILVGAGACPTATGRLDRERLEFSNHGSCLDAQGWGESVVTAGYGDLQDDPNQLRKYTATFGGTSSAAPVVAGALACVQGILRARGVAPLTPAEARGLLRSTGSPQQWPHGKLQGSERVGNRPDLKALAQAAAELRAIA